MRWRRRRGRHSRAGACLHSTEKWRSSSIRQGRPFHAQRSSLGFLARHGGVIRLRAVVRHLGKSTRLWCWPETSGNGQGAAVESAATDRRQQGRPRGWPWRDDGVEPRSCRDFAKQSHRQPRHCGVWTQRIDGAKLWARRRRPAVLLMPTSQLVKSLPASPRRCGVPRGLAAAAAAAGHQPDSLGSAVRP